MHPSHTHISEERDPKLMGYIVSGYLRTLGVAQNFRSKVRLASGAGREIAKYVIYGNPGTFVAKSGQLLGDSVDLHLMCNVSRYPGASEGEDFRAHRKRVVTVGYGVTS